MCGTCGCHHSDHSGLTHEQMHALGIEHDHSHHDHHETGHRHNVEQDILAENNLTASRNRGFFEARHIFAINLVSSPGSGKTSLLEKTLALLKDRTGITVIEGDQQTDNDAGRIRALGIACKQINTQNGCHLDADMVYRAVKELNPPDGSVLFIENVGNLVCPALFDLGENQRAVMISVTEGDDKPLKYPYMFESADICIINKIDLLPYVPSDLQALRQNALKVNPDLRFFEVSAITGEGLNLWCEYLSEQVNRLKE